MSRRRDRKGARSLHCRGYDVQRIGEPELRAAFSTFGNVIDVYLPKDFFTKQLRGFAYIQFENEAEADNAREKLDRTDVFNDNHQVNIMWAVGERKTPNDMRRLDIERDNPHAKRQRESERGDPGRDRDRDWDRRSDDRRRDRGGRDWDRNHSYHGRWDRDYDRDRNRDRDRFRDSDRDLNRDGYGGAQHNHPRSRSPRFRRHDGEDRRGGYRPPHDPADDRERARHPRDARDRDDRRGEWDRPRDPDRERDRHHSRERIRDRDRDYDRERNYDRRDRDRDMGRGDRDRYRSDGHDNRKRDRSESPDRDAKRRRRISASPDRRHSRSPRSPRSPRRHPPRPMSRDRDPIDDHRQPPPPRNDAGPPSPRNAPPSGPSAPIPPKSEATPQLASRAASKDPRDVWAGPRIASGDGRQENGVKDGDVVPPEKTNGDAPSAPRLRSMPAPKLRSAQISPVETTPESR